MLYLTEEDVKACLTIEDCVEAVEAAYRADGCGEAPQFSRDTLKLPDRGSYKILSGALPGLGVMGTLGYSGGFPRHRSPFECRKLLTLFSTHTGEPLVCMEAEHLSWLRTGATAGVAARHLSAETASRVAVLGSGRQARSTLMAVSVVRGVEEARVFSPTKEHRETYASEMTVSLDFPVHAVGSARDAVRGADIVITVTSHRQPVYLGEWMEAGVTVLALGAHDPDRRELDGACLQRAGLVTVDQFDQALEEEGEWILAQSEGCLPLSARPVPLGAVVAGGHPGRREPEECIVFLSGGVALEYLAVGHCAYRNRVGCTA